MRTISGRQQFSEHGARLVNVKASPSGVLIATYRQGRR